MELLNQLYDGDYWFARFLIQRAVGLIYLIAFINVLNQFRPLLGEKGLLPVPDFTKRIPFAKSPSIFHWHYSDRFLALVAWAGILLSVLALSGAADSGPLWLSMTTWFLLWLLYLSVVNIGQVFYSFGWESMLLEAGFFAIFLGPLHMAAPVLVIWIYRWMLFRVEFGAGMIKMRGDPCWHDLTCMNYHHETQPLPNPLSRYFHLLPAPFHKIETFCNHLVQLIVVWGLFFPQPVAAVSASLIMVSQGYLIISGNYSWLNWLTLSLGFSAFSDGMLERLTGLAPPAVSPIPMFFQYALIILGVAVLIMSVKPIINILSSNQKMNFSFNPLHLVNTYGAFGNVTKQRNEIVLEGTRERTVTEDTEWKEYEFRAKPGSPRRPPQVSPYHLRLDWQMWFAAMLSPGRHPWLNRLILKLLRGDQATENLLRHVPFGPLPPTYIRALLYRYEFTTRAERKRTGRWWKRSYHLEYIRPLSLEDL